MIKYKYLLPLLLAAYLNCIMISAKADTETPVQGSIGSASSGWDKTGLTDINPDSDVRGQSVYDPNYNHSALPVNRPQTNGYSDYTANAPGEIAPGPNSNLPSQFRPGTSLPATSQRGLTPINPKLKLRPGTNLPETTLDGFVAASGFNDSIYGDEGGNSPPGASNFGYISHGFNKQMKQGLTTGHGSKLPSAWGGDEFHGNEHSVSGPSYASSPVNNILNILAPPAPTNLLTR